MRILQINKFYYLKGGAERYFFELSRLLEKNGHKVIPFSMADSLNSYSIYNKYFSNTVDVNNFSFKDIIKIFYNYEAARRLNKLIKKEKPDIAHLHNIYYHLSPSIINVLRKNNIPIVQTLHDYKIICPNYKLFSDGNICYKCKNKKYYNCLFRKCVKNSKAKSLLAMTETYIHNFILKTYFKIDVFIAPSDFLKNAVIEFGVSPEKIKTAHNFIDPSYLSITKNKITANNNFILYFGRLSNEKGINVLLEAMLKIHKNISLKIAGAGPELENLKKITLNLDLKNRVELLGIKHGHELSELLNNAKAIIIPSIWPENMPYTMLESMAMGKIVIASRIGGIPEVITDRTNGFLFKPGDSSDLAEKINEMDKFDLKTIGSNAKKTAAAFNPKNHYNEIMEIYKNLISC
ncbi:MAG: glycosyltransferase family 4 protein [bacterium]